MTKFAVKSKMSESHFVKSKGSQKKFSDLQAASMNVQTPLFGFPIQLKADCACGGGCPNCQKKELDVPVSQPTDPSEIEADQMADRVINESQGETRETSQNQASDEPLIQTKLVRNDSKPQTLSSKIFSTQGKGQSLDGKTLSFMQNRFQTDFSDVKIHTNREAVIFNSELNAKAFTLGNDIYFNEGQFKPESIDGKHLLAHELTHVVQQNNSFHAARRKIHRAPPDSAAPPAPAANTPPKQQGIKIIVVLDKDCSKMSPPEFRTFVMQLLLSQTFGFDYMTSVGAVSKYKYDFTVFSEKSSRASGSQLPVTVFKDFYRQVLVDKYGVEDPRIDQLVAANFGDGTAPVDQQKLKESSKLMQLDDLKGKLTPLEMEFLKAKLNWKTGTVDQSLESYRKLLENLQKYKKSLDWYAFLKTKLSPVEYYRTIAAELLKTERLYHLIYTRQALQVQGDPLSIWYKTDMSHVYAQYPWLKDVEAQLQKDYVTYPSQSDGEQLIKREMELAGFKSLSEYEDFVKLYAAAFYGVVASKISDQLDVNEAIVNKEKTFYTNQGATPFVQTFGQFKADYDQIDKEHDENRGRFSNLPDGTQKFNDKLAELKEKEKNLDVRVQKVRDENKAGFPILEDKDLTNRELAQQDSPRLQKTLLSLTEKRLGYIAKTRENLAKKPEHFVVQVADGKYVQLAKDEIGFSSSSFENIVIDGRMSKVKADDALVKTTLMALTIGLGLLTLPFSGTAAAIVGIPGFALGVFTSVEEFKEYRVKKAAAGTSFSAADAISNDDPSLVWLVVGLAGTALEGLILAKTFASLAKSRYLKYGMPEKEFVREVEETILKEAPDLAPNKLQKLRKLVADKAEQAEEFKAGFDKALAKFNKKEVPDPKVVQLNMVILPIPPHKVDAVLEMIYWAIRRGINKVDQFLIESKIAGIEKTLLEQTFAKALAKFQGKTALSKSEYQEFVLDMYKDFGYEVKDIFVRNKVTGTGAHMKALKKADGSFEFLELDGMTTNAQEIISDMKAGGKDLQVGTGTAEKVSDFSKVRGVEAPVKLLSDIPQLNTILTDVEKILEPITEFRRSARQISADLTALKAKGGNATDIGRLENMLAGAQKKLSDNGAQLISKADELEKEALLITDIEQKRKLLQRAEAIRDQGKLLGYDIKVQDAVNLRSNLRKALRTGELFGDKAAYYNAHHIFPVEMIDESPVLRKAIEGGFEFNGTANGINLSQFSSKFRTENIIVEFIGDGKKATITVNNKLLGEVEVIDKGGGITGFKMADKEVGTLSYSKQVKGDGQIIEGGTIEITDTSGTIKQTVQESPLGSHASHPNYSSEIKKKLDAIDAKYPSGIDNQKAAEEVTALAKEIKDKILSAKDTPGFKIDDLFK